MSACRIKVVDSSPAENSQRQYASASRFSCGKRYVLLNIICRMCAGLISNCVAFQKRKTPSSPEDEGYTIAHRKGRRGVTIDKLWLIRVVPKAASMWMAELEMQT